MNINKISVGVETLQNPVRVEVISESKLHKVKETVALASGKIGRLTKRIYIKVKKLLKSVPAFMKQRKTKEESSNDKEVIHEDKSKLKEPDKIKKGVILIVAFVLLISVAVVAKVKLLNPDNSPNSSASADKVEIKGPLKTLDINKEFQFPVRDTKGKEITKFKYLIEKAELRDEIIVKGQKATAVKGRVFLIIYLRITNEYSQKLDIPSKNYMRLSVNGNENEWLASDIHNDPVEVQAQSTKVTRLGFPIYESDMNLVLRVGEIDGDKEKVELNF